jgi:DNA-directed RNA polymerase subunit RPC12/RpoP
LITVAAYFSAVEAHVDRLALEQAGLKAWVTGEYHGENYGIGSGAILQVRSEDMAAAMDILEAPPAPASALPPELADIHCPRCGSSEITEVEEVLDVLDSSSTSLSSSPRQLWLYRCAACKHEWSAK